MATVRTARLVEREPIRDGALLRFAVSDGAPLAFRGGQYAIVDTGLTLPDGKRRKRAYSFCSSDAREDSFELGVFPVRGGLGAAYMLALAPAAELTFSGPWGKLVAPSAELDVSGSTRDRNSDSKVWVLATDSGITAAIGLVRGRDFGPALSRTTLSWWTAAPDYFLSREAVEARLPERLSLEEARLPFTGSPERSFAVAQRLEELARRGEPALVYVMGDGQVPALVRAWLDARGLASVPLQSENFFHHPVRKSASLQAG
jgi:ferredoxin-NADP reductase